ncbi:hypothetical protein WK07_04470 [Burkholderia multivorans]|uniref:XF1762 family protein n=1 Tax=Burkholderia multivorans TaxID=87883 RepID=UPI0007546A64|nr:XF1762 family protein [Burkholderia multivorans]KVQ85550.1 hypothetical protein WK07_04470 [Burkholderia multivorans]
MGLRVIPVSLKDANAFVAALHRHHKPVQGHKFSIGAALDLLMVGVCIVGRPVSRHRDDGKTLEVTRMCTDGTKNACSILYAAAARAAFAMGYERIGTYTMAHESGASLRAAGWECTGETPGRSWSVPSREREDKHPIGKKLRWEKFNR